MSEREEQIAETAWSDAGEAVVRSRIGGRGLVSALLGATVVATGAGFLLRLDGFAGNVLAELGGVALSVLIAVTLVEMVLARERRTRWQGVRAATLAALANRVRDLAFDFYLVNSKPESYLRASDPGAIADTYDELAEGLRQSAPGLAESEDDEVATSRHLLREVRADLGFIRDVLAPRLRQLGEDPYLIELLIDLEDAERDWANGIRLIYDNWGFPNELAWVQAARTFAAASRLYRFATTSTSSR